MTTLDAHDATTETIGNAAQRREQLAQAIDAVNEILLGKEEQVRLAFSCLLARGHLLIEDLPGVGKTTERLPQGAEMSRSKTSVPFQRTQQKVRASGRARNAGEARN